MTRYRLYIVLEKVNVGEDGIVNFLEYIVRCAFCGVDFICVVY